LAEHSGCVRQKKRRVLPGSRLLDQIAGGAGYWGNNGAAIPDDSIEKCRFPDIRAPDKHDGWELFGHWLLSLR
jgi:hypothetical protein